jgi:hypothetical protein
MKRRPETLPIRLPRVANKGQVMRDTGDPAQITLRTAKKCDFLRCFLGPGKWVSGGGSSCEIPACAHPREAGGNVLVRVFIFTGCDQPN